MAKRTTKKTTKPVRPQLGDGVEILNAGSVLEDPITSTLETNYMPYAMSVIVSRALPEIDGFKPAHRKLLYTMYGMGLLKGARTKSANIVGSTMHLNPHGDAAIYDTMVRMGRGNESLLVPFVDSKGNFGKAYSRDMSCAAARYTEAKLEGVCEELFRDIDKETVDFVPNYDGTTTEPTLLPVTFPTILANNTLGIAVGMACNICSFNLAELCATTVALMKDPKHDISTTMPAPDFVGGGQILYDEAQMREVYENGRGSIKVRARYNVVPGENMLEITLPCLLPKRKQRQSTEFLIDPLYFTLSQYSDNNELPKFRQCVVCFSHIYSEKFHNRRVRDYDNLELKQLLDVLSTFIMVDDTGLLVDAYNTTEIGEADCTRISVMAKEDFPKWLNEREKSLKTISDF